MNPQEITTHALALGITRELYPEFWGYHCTACDRRWGQYITSCPRCQSKHIELRVYLPSPLSDDPRACFYEPFYMRALEWPKINYSKGARLWFLSKPTFTKLSTEDFYALTEALRHGEGPTPTAALHAAFLAKGVKE